MINDYNYARETRDDNLKRDYGIEGKESCGGGEGTWKDNTSQSLHSSIR